MRILDPVLDEALSTLNASPEERAMLVGFLENQVASIQGQIAGLRANAENAVRQADELEPHLAALAAMLDKFTDEAPAPSE